MINIYRIATSSTLVGFAVTLVTFHSQAQNLGLNDYLTLGEGEINAGMYDQARHDLTQAFQIAKANHDVATLLRLTEDFNKILNRASPPPYYVSSYESDVVGAYVTALDTAHDEACYDPNVPGSGTNVAHGQADLRGVISLITNLFGNPSPSTSGFVGTLASLQLAAEGYLSESLAGNPACRPAPSPSMSAPPNSSGTTYVPPSTSGPTPAPPSTSGSTPAPTNTSGSEPAPTNTSGSEPTPTNTSGSEPAPTKTSGSEPAPAPTSG
jgi:hypothetical protein